MLTWGLVSTALGRVALVYDAAESDRSRPIMLCIHGFLRDSGALLHWHRLLSDDVQAVFAELPGHGRTPPEGDCGIDLIAERIALAMQAACRNRQIVVLGESTGGLVALALADGRLPQLRGVIAGDPPLTAAKQWTVQASASRVLERGDANSYLARFSEAVFGIGPAGQVSERMYYDLVAKSSVPTLLLTGDNPLWPVRMPTGVPCLMDEVDIETISGMGNPLVRVHRLKDRGHLVLADDEHTPAELVRTFSRDALSRRPVSPAHSASISESDRE